MVSMPGIFWACCSWHALSSGSVAGHDSIVTFVIEIISKGQVTIPAEVRKALDVGEGDDLLFEVVEAGEARIRVLKRRRLSDLYGALPATRSYPGKEEVRTEVSQGLGDGRSGEGRGFPDPQLIPEYFRMRHPGAIMCPYAFLERRPREA
jgi:antitoxin PrlF